MSIFDEIPFEKFRRMLLTDRENARAILEEKVRKELEKSEKGRSKNPS